MSKPKYSTLARVKALSLATLLQSPDDRTESGVYTLENIDRARVNSAIDKLKDILQDGTGKQLEKKMFKTIGLATDIQVTEDFGTQAIYGIGNAGRPELVFSNQSVNINVSKLTIDTRDIFSYVTRPEYWLDTNVYCKTKGNNFLLYTYIYVENKQHPEGNQEIYAVLPRSRNFRVDTSNPIISDSVTFAGFKYSFEEIWTQLSNITDLELNYLINDLAQVEA